MMFLDTRLHCDCTTFIDLPRKFVPTSFHCAVAIASWYYSKFFGRQYVISFH
jgi:hypothetical protein